MKVRTVSAVAVGAVSLLALSGCGSDLGPTLHPGQAAVVGDHEISLDEVDAGAEAFCAAVLKDPSRQWKAQPMSGFRTDYVDALVKEELAKKYAEAHDLDVSDQHRANMKSFEAQLTDERNNIPKEARSALRDYIGHVSYAQSVEYAVGTDKLTESGQQPKSEEDVLAAGEQVLVDWADEAGIEVDVDPRFDMVGDGSNALSVPVSDRALLPTDPKADQAKSEAYLASLPASQKCS